MTDASKPAGDFRTLFEAAQAADDAWQLAVDAAFPRLADARYRPEGASTPELRALRSAKRAADEALHSFFEASREASNGKIVYRDGGWRHA